MKWAPLKIYVSSRPNMYARAPPQLSSTFRIPSIRAVRHEVSEEGLELRMVVHGGRQGVFGPFFGGGRRGRGKYCFHTREWGTKLFLSKNWGAEAFSCEKELWNKKVERAIRNFWPIWNEGPRLFLISNGGGNPLFGLEFRETQTFFNR